jgi:hypothetical protein
LGFITEKLQAKIDTKLTSIKELCVRQIASHHDLIRMFRLFLRSVLDQSKPSAGSTLGRSAYGLDVPRLLGGRDDLLKYFTERCGDFFVEPLKLIRPRVIITRVVYVLQLIASRSESLEEWPTDRSFSDIDRIGLLHFDVGFKGCRGQKHVSFH